MTKAIYFDMDGTIADLYGVENWLDYLVAEQTKPYREAKPLISWLARGGSDEYGDRVAQAKEKWLAKHLGSVQFDEIKIAKYGTPKQFLADHAFGILFDEEQQNRDAWVGEAYDVHNILQVLTAIAA